MRWANDRTRQAVCGIFDEKRRALQHTRLQVYVVGCDAFQAGVSIAPVAEVRTGLAQCATGIG